MSQPVSAAEPLAFADRKTDGAFLVTAEDGRVLARITTKWGGSSFEATDGTGAALCSGRHRSAFSRDFDGFDAAGAVIVTLRSGWGSRKTVTLPDGTEWQLRGRAFSRDFAVTDAAGQPTLAAEPANAGLSFRPDAFVVRCLTERLSFAQVVAIVEINRLMIKRARGAATAGGAAAASS